MVVVGMEQWCVLCDSRAVAEVDVSVGLPAGLCHDHLEMWMTKHPELRPDPNLSSRRSG
jgi:hypothetical protein